MLEENFISPFFIYRHLKKYFFIIFLKINLFTRTKLGVDKETIILLGLEKMMNGKLPLKLNKDCLSGW